MDELKNGLHVSHHGVRCWYLDGQLHRDNLPAVDWPSGTSMFYQHGELHNEDGPAFVRGDGFLHKAWWQHGRRHREDGPALIESNGTTEWWINDQKLNENIIAYIENLLEEIKQIEIELSTLIKKI